MPPPNQHSQGEFARNLEIGAQNLSQFVQTLPNAAIGLTGLIQSVKTASLTVSAFGAAIAGPLGALLGLPGTLAAAGLQAGMGLAGAAAPNGLQSVDKSFDILAGTIGGIVQPAFVALGALALMGADAMRAWIKENKAGIIQGFISSVETATAGLKEFRDWLPGGSHWMPGGAAFGFHPLAGAGGQAGDNMAEKLRALQDKEAALAGGIPGKRKAGIDVQVDEFELARIRSELADQMRIHGGGFGGGAGGGGDFGNAVNAAGGAAAGGGNPFFAKLADNMDKLARDIATSVGKPSISDPTSKWKEVATAISQSELEARKVAMQRENLDLLRDIIRAIRELAQPGGGKNFVIPPWAVLG